jgi:hypothetical protein
MEPLHLWIFAFCSLQVTLHKTHSCSRELRKRLVSHSARELALLFPSFLGSGFVGCSHFSLGPETIYTVDVLGIAGAVK